MTYRIDGSKMVLELPPCGEDIDCPYVVDPIIDNYAIDPNGTRSTTQTRDPFYYWRAYATGPNSVAQPGDYSPAYPGYQGTDFRQNPNGFWMYRGFNGQANGLYAYSPPYDGSTHRYLNNDFGEWLWAAPGESVISRAVFGGVAHQPSGTCLIEGVFNYRALAWENGRYSSQPNADPSSGPTSPWYGAGRGNGADDACGPQSNDTKFHSFVGSGATRRSGSEVVFGIQTQYAYYLNQQPTAYMYGTAITLDDIDTPNVVAGGTNISYTPPGGSSATTNLPTDWIRGGTLKLSADIYDPGLGVRNIQLSDVTGGADTTVVDKPAPVDLAQTTQGVGGSVNKCSGGKDSRCPRRFNPANGGATITTSLDQIGEGARTLRFSAHDAVGFAYGDGHTATIADIPVKVDRTPPTLDITGELYDIDGGDADIYAGGQSVSVVANDASNASGIRSVELTIDGSDPDPSRFKSAQSCNGADCPALTPTFTVESASLADGVHSLQVKALDGAGNPQTVDWTINVDHSQPRPGSCSNSDDDGQPQGRCDASQAAPDKPSEPADVPNNCDVTTTGSLSSVETADQASARTDLEMRFGAVVAPAVVTTFGSLRLAPVVNAAVDQASVSGSAVDSRISAAAADGFRIGSGADAVCLRPVGASASKQSEVTNSGTLLTPLVWPNTDQISRATALGVKTLLHVRSGDSPDKFTWTVSAAPGSTLQRTDNGDVAVVAPWVPPDQTPDDSDDFAVASLGSDQPSTARSPDLAAVSDVAQQLTGSEDLLSSAQRVSEGNVLAVVHRPWAIDSEGQTVPVSLAFHGMEVTVSLGTDRSTIHYPIVVDPEVSSADGANDSSSTASDRTEQSAYSAEPQARAACLPGAGAYCGLNDEEKRFCKHYGFETCLQFAHDASDSQNVTRFLFLPAVPQDEIARYFDSTKANAFTHAFWNAQMVLTSRQFGNISLGYKFAVAHEAHAYNSRQTRTAYPSRMDMHQNRLGYRFGKTHLDHNHRYMCSSMRHIVPSGAFVHGNPDDYRGVLIDSLIWTHTRTLGGKGRIVNLARHRSCDSAYGTESLNLHNP